MLSLQALFNPDRFMHVKEIIVDITKVHMLQNHFFCHASFLAKYCVMWKCPYPRSSVGLAKAALEAINGFNLFGNQVRTFTCVFL